MPTGPEALSVSTEALSARAPGGGGGGPPSHKLRICWGAGPPPGAFGATLPLSGGGKLAPQVEDAPGAQLALFHLGQRHQRALR
jgi:hypothetical protein